MTKIIQEHEGQKYLREIYPAMGEPASITKIDVYCVLEAFKVTCPARAQAIKKLLCCGIRGKENEMEDLKGAEAAISRAIELQENREIKEKVRKKMSEANFSSAPITNSQQVYDELHKVPFDETYRELLNRAGGKKLELLQKMNDAKRAYISTTLEEYEELLLELGRSCRRK